MKYIFDMDIFVYLKGDYLSDSWYADDSLTLYTIISEKME
ncbi:hypothetical protein bcere0004_56600 [Bacillus cereus BGSC 6E1]|nr:hypothetical protein bcere0004_56600 [Bacillus cereus BGSC 6E1]